MTLTAIRSLAGSNKTWCRPESDQALTKPGNPSRIPVIIGCGQINDRAATGSEGRDSLELMIAAARAAGDDAGESVLQQIDWLGIVNQISFPQLTGTLVDGISRELGISPAFTHETPTPTGDGPILLINMAANAIGEGKASAALIVGAEALRTAARRKAEAAASGTTAAKVQSPYPPRIQEKSSFRIAYGLVTPSDVYPFYDNAARPVYGQTLAEGQAETGEIWSNMSQVAARNPHAWLRQPRTAREVIEPSADNRPIAHPYTKLMVANAAVNQGAALIVTSLAVARAAGVPFERIIYVGKGAAAHEDEGVLTRADFALSPAAQVSITRALELNRLSITDCDHIELYSCFPCIPKMARRIAGLPASAPMTVFGGLTFGGGPIGNYMAHAAACMVEALRKSGTNGFLFANGGYATHNHSIVLTRVPQPEGTFPQDFDFQAEADGLRPPVPEMLEEYEGPAKVETYTVLYGRAGEVRHGLVVALTPGGQRTLAKIEPDDDAALATLMDGDVEPVGMTGSITRSDGFNFWTFAAHS